MSNEIWGSSIQVGDFVAPSELVTPPVPQRIKGQVLLWSLTLASFLGGTYYGFLFQRTPADTDTRLAVVDDGTALVARWNAGSVGITSAQHALLRVTAGGLQRQLDLDKVALQKGEMVLDADPDERVEVELMGPGLGNHARFVPGDSLETGGPNADRQSLQQQIKDQQQLNMQMERRLAQGRQ